MLGLTKSQGLEIKDVSTSNRMVTGYFAAFDMLDSDGDIIQKGAFTKTIAERGPQGTGRRRIKYLQDHDPYKTVGTIQVLKEDNYGLYYEGKVGTHTAGEDFLKMVTEGIIAEHSFGYRVIQEEKNQKGENVLKELFMKEGSGLQVDAANPFTPVTGVKSAEDVVTLFQALEKALKSGTYSDECFKDIIIPQYESLKNTLPDLQQSTTEPKIKEDDLKSILENIKFY